MMMAAHVNRAERRARVFANAPLPGPADLEALLDAEMDDDEAARQARLRDILRTGFVRVLVYPGDMALPDVLFAYLVAGHGESVFACVVVSEQRVQTMLLEAPLVIEGFSLQVAQGDGNAPDDVEAALAAWAARNFPGLPVVGFEVDRWLEAPPTLPASWDLDASVADPPYRAAA
jgi:hypothetical protein